MQVVLNADHHIDRQHKMAQHLRMVVRDAVAQFGVHVTRVAVHIADENSSFKTSPDDVQHSGSWADWPVTRDSQSPYWQC